MMRALFSAISGMKNHMSFMDVVGNNIANVNTIAYKSSRVTFQDILGQQVKGASSPQNGRGGTNPAQIGLGMNLGGIDTIMTQGSIQSTGKLTDFAIQGDGFFVVSDGQRNFFTRDGAFDIGVDGGLVNPVTGLRVMGWAATAAGVIDTQSPLSALQIPFGTRVSAQPSTLLTFAGNLDASTPIGGAVNTTVTVYDSLGVANSVKLTFSKVDQIPNGPSTWAVADNNAVAIANSANVTITGTPSAIIPPGIKFYDNGAGQVRVVQPGGIPGATTTAVLPTAGTNTTLIPGVTLTMAAAYGAAGVATVVIPSAAAFNPVPSGAAVNTNSGNITISGSPTSTAPGTYRIVDDGAGNVSVTFTPENSTVIPLGVGASNTTIVPGLTLKGPAAFGAAGTASLSVTGTQIKFSNAGQYLPTNPPVNIALRSTNGSGIPQNVQLNIANFTQFAGQSQVNLTSQDGFPAGALVSFAVGSSGEVSGIYSNGSNRVIGQLALATFVNPGGLQRSGQNLWIPSSNSGDAIVGTPNSNGRGTVNTGTLEGSNVDLAQQFTNVIIAQRGFQSSSRVITASDQMLQDLVNIIR